MGVVLLMAVLLTVGCSSDEDLNGAVPVVTAQLNFSLPSRIVGVRHPNSTRMTDNVVQEGGKDEEFRGITDVQLLCFDQYPTATSNKLGGMIDINTKEAEELNPTEEDYSLCQQIEIPVGTSYFSFYASATEELTPEEKELYKDQHERRMHFGAIETAGLSKSTYHGNGGIRFKPVQICTSTDPLGGSDIGKDLLQLLNDLMEIIDPAGNLYLNEAYQRLTEFSTLSSYNVQTMLGFILKLVNQKAPDNQGSQSVSAVTAKITSCCAKDEKQKPIADIENGVIELKEAYQGFPADIHLPDGAARIKWNSEKGKFEVPDKQEYGNDLTVTSVNDYVYPISLEYQVFSNILASEEMVILKQNDEGEAVPLDDEDKYESWQDLIENGYKGASSTVRPTTQSVAMVRQVEYAVGRLSVRSKIARQEIKDANGKSVDVLNYPPTLKGYVVGSQREVDYDLQPVTTSRTYAIYDTDLNGDAPHTVNQWNWTDTDYILGFSTSADQSILVALELVNNAQDFQGADGVIAHGATFYLVANLNPKDDGEHYQSGTLDRVFIKDYFTNVNITINSLASATYGLPNLDIPRPTVGLSVDLRWEDGLWYPEVPL